MTTREKYLEALTKAREWFDLAKYEPRRTFTQQQWGQQIARRHFLLVASAKDRDGPPDMDVLSRMVPEVMEDPCSNWPYSISRKPIRELNKADISRLSELEGFESGNNDEHVDQLLGEVTSGRSWFGHLLIDLGSSEKDLLAAFVHWVRTRQALLRIPHKNNFGEHLQSTKVLPYVDLVAWSALTGNPLREEDYIALLGMSSPSADFRNQYRTVVRNKKTYINLTVAHLLLMGCAT